MHAHWVHQLDRVHQLGGLDVLFCSGERAFLNGTAPKNCLEAIL